MVNRRAPGRQAESVGAAEVSVAVRVKPGAGRTAVGGRYDGPHGPALIVSVGAPAVDGKATEAVRRALADALGVRPATVTLKIGATSRDKVFAVAAPPEPRSAGGVGGSAAERGREGSRPGVVEGLVRRVAALRDGGG